MPGIRTEKVNAAVQKSVANTINTKINDPRINGIISVSSVKVSADLRHAKVFLSILSTDKQAVFDAVVSAHGFIRKNLAADLKMKATPELAFVLDNGQENEDRVLELLDKIKSQRVPY